jgi:branched-chain amino acid transport system permease protein
VLLADWLSTLWPRWLLLLGLLLIGVSIGMQRGLWGLGEAIWNRIFRRKPPIPNAPAAQGEKA